MLNEIKNKKMKTIQKLLGTGLLLVFLFNGEYSEAQRKRTSTQRTKVTNHHRGDRYRTQPIYRNPRYRYPTRRRVVRTIHRNHLRFVYGGLSYFYYAGIYYTVYGDGYITVVPPIGMRITVLPVGYVRIVVGPQVYFYHSGVYYVESKEKSDENKYEISPPPVGAQISELPEGYKEIVMDDEILYVHNDVFYKKITTEKGEIRYKVVYYNENSNEESK